MNVASLTTLDGLGIWVGALLTLCVLSFLYKENPFYRFAEHAVVGASVGYGLVLSYFLMFKPYWIDEMILGVAQGKPRAFAMIPAGLVGLCWLTALSPRWGWLARYPMAVTMGVGSGYAIPIMIQAGILVHMRATWENLIIRGDGGIDVLGTIWGATILIGVLSVLCYFFFSLPHKGVYGHFTKLGIWFLMISFGASFGYTVMARLSLFVGRLQFLLSDWLGLIQ
jgi:hypothetical protein